MRALEVLREGARNHGAGTSRALTSLIVFIFVAGILGTIATRMVVGVSQEAANYQTAGASVYRVDLPGRIDSQACDQISHMPGVLAAGASRQATDLTFALLRGLPIAVSEVTPGFIQLVGAEQNDPTSQGIILDVDLADSLGLVALPAALAVVGKPDPVPVLGTYLSPDDGRDTALSSGALAISNHGVYDACWVRYIPPIDNPMKVMGLALLPEKFGGEDQVIAPVQWNTSLGATLDPGQAFANLPLGWLIAAGGVLGIVLGAILTRLRKLEMSSALHAGADRWSLTSISAVEVFIWLGPAVGLLLGGLVWGAHYANPDPYWPAWQAGARVIAASAAGWLVGVCAVTVLTKEQRLIKYFQQR
ncbi:hypothetical protein V5R04_06655 [Jonesiaceae bacterium BS-20]|uniref:ABC transporter permease n=1 Tax=Jonesiaceae bacterium BS-20 TaxID=3120821 RepID=A0AAU7E0R6_9MICO